MFIIGSHNSWTYITPIKWWMKLIKFTAKCQNLSIIDQYKLGVTCFDLRIRYKNGRYYISHGLVDYLNFYDIDNHAGFYNSLYYLNTVKNCKIRVLHDVRNESDYTILAVSKFKVLCYKLTKAFPDIEFFCGRNLVNWDIDYDFGTKEYDIAEEYASVKKPKSIYAIWPWLFSSLNNKSIIKKGTNKDILLIDFVDIY